MSGQSDRAPMDPAGPEPKRSLADRSAAMLRVIQGGLRPPMDISEDSGFKEIRLGRRILFGFFGVLGVWAAFAPLDSGVVAPGVIKVSGNRQTVQHRDGGTITTLHVKEGERVKEGDILLEFSTNEIGAQDKSLTAQAIELEATRARLLAEQSGAATIIRPAAWADLPGNYAKDADIVLARQTQELGKRRAAQSAQESVLRERGAQLTARIVGYGKRVNASRTQLALIDEELVGLRQLAEQGLVPQNRIRQREGDRAALEGSLGLAEASIEETKEGFGETEMQITSLRQSRDKEVAELLRDTETRLADVSPRVAAVREQLAAASVRAPVAGTVVGLKYFTNGGVVRAGDPILDIVPDAQPLVIEARIRPEDADNVTAGQKTEIRFSGIRSTRLPIIHGEVTRISADRFDDQRTGMGYFLAEVTVPQAELNRAAKAINRKSLPLRAGLPAETIIPLKKRSALQFLLDPLGQSLWQSFRAE